MNARRLTPGMGRAGLGVAALVMLLAVVGAGAAVGESAIPVHEVAQVLANRLFDAGFSVDAIDAGIIWEYRLTRTLVAACCGAGLALSGVVLQALLRNPLAEPYLMGISAGASTGAVLIAVAGVGAGTLTLSGGALIGAVVSFALVVALARLALGGAAGQAAGEGDTAVTGTIILAGVAGSSLFNAVTALVIAHSASAEQTRGLMFWLMGNLSGVRWPDVALAAPAALAALGVCLAHRRALDAFAFGRDTAASLGVAVRWVQPLLIAAVALVTAVMVSIVGAIGFVGLIVPHGARFLVGSQHSLLLPVSALAGAVFLIAADVVSRVLIAGQVLPIGVVTSLIGAPVFAALLVNRRRAA
ncbi:iron ABC transporter permease [uncultured Salinisphaera sp.]|uniref:FecCD family ABC transporter permease n=1 Tax=uncultured Salinisphaera sp. TaxID=359372 RepID=UPI0032B12175|tara:strand:- start:3025 stop:4098 length:1074 start_codon:yes stop_codon:yes gene_type:complete